MSWEASKAKTAEEWCAERFGEYDPENLAQMWAIEGWEAGYEAGQDEGYESARMDGHGRDNQESLELIRNRISAMEEHIARLQILLGRKP